MDPEHLAVQLKRLYDKCKLFPEDNRGGWIAMIEIRNLTPEAIDFLHELAAYRACSVVRSEGADPKVEFLLVPRDES